MNTRLNSLLQAGIEQVKSTGINPGKINPEVLINTRARRFGQCKKTTTISQGQVYDYQIEINKRLLATDEDKLMTVVIHEILHTCKGCLNHGQTWKKYANMMSLRFGYEITTRSTYEELNLAKPPSKYTVQCANCDVLIGRQKKSKLITHTHLYRCKCGGKLTLK